MVVPILEIFNGNIVATSCANWIQIGPYPTEYLSNYQTDLHQLFSFGRNMYKDYSIDISFVVA